MLSSQSFNSIPSQRNSSPLRKPKDVYHDLKTTLGTTKWVGNHSLTGHKVIEKLNSPETTQAMLVTLFQKAKSIPEGYKKQGNITDFMELLKAAMKTKLDAVSTNSMDRPSAAAREQQDVISIISTPEAGEFIGKSSEDITTNCLARSTDDTINLCVRLLNEYERSDSVVVKERLSETINTVTDVITNQLTKSFMLQPAESLEKFIKLEKALEKIPIDSIQAKLNETKTNLLATIQENPFKMQFFEHSRVSLDTFNKLNTIIHSSKNNDTKNIVSMVKDTVVKMVSLRVDMSSHPKIIKSTFTKEQNDDYISQTRTLVNEATFDRIYESQINAPLDQLVEAFKRDEPIPDFKSRLSQLKCLTSNETLLKFAGESRSELKEILKESSSKDIIRMMSDLKTVFTPEFSVVRDKALVFSAVNNEAHRLLGDIKSILNERASRFLSNTENVMSKYNELTLLTPHLESSLLNETDRTCDAIFKESILPEFRSLLENPVENKESILTKLESLFPENVEVRSQTLLRLLKPHIEGAFDVTSEAQGYHQNNGELTLEKPFRDLLKRGDNDGQFKTDLHRGTEIKLSGDTEFRRVSESEKELVLTDIKTSMNLSTTWSKEDQSLLSLCQQGFPSEIIEGMNVYKYLPDNADTDTTALLNTYGINFTYSKDDMSRQLDLVNSEVKLSSPVLIQLTDPDGRLTCDRTPSANFMNLGLSYTMTYSLNSGDNPTVHKRIV